MSRTVIMLGQVPSVACFFCLIVVTWLMTSKREVIRGTTISLLSMQMFICLSYLVLNFEWTADLISGVCQVPSSIEILWSCLETGYFACAVLLIIKIYTLSLYFYNCEGICENASA